MKQDPASAIALIALVLCLVVPGSSGAQSAADARQTACEVQVTASPLPFRQFDKVELTGSAILSSESRQAQPVDVICRRRIDASGASGLSQLLSQWPGLLYRADSASLQALGGIGPLPAAIHGHPEGTLVLLNGRRLPLFGLQGLAGERALVDLDMVPLSAVGHIDIMPDGASARYGSDATAGVVNIITRPVTPGTTLRVQGRTRGGQLANLSWGSDLSRQQGPRLQAHLETERQDGLLVGQQPGAMAPGMAAASVAASLQPAMERHLLYMDGQWTLSPAWEAFAQVIQGQTRLDSQLDSVFSRITATREPMAQGLPWLQNATSGEPFSRQHQRRAYQQFTGGVRGQWQAWDLVGSISSGQHRVDREQYPLTAMLAPTGPLDQGTTRLNTLDLLGSRLLGEREGQPVSLGLGLNWREESLVYRPWLSGLQSLDASRQLWALHGELLIPVADAQQLSLALRHDRYSDMGAVNTGKLAWRWQMSPGLMLRASTGQGFRAPSPSQRSSLQMAGMQVTDPLGGQSVAVALRGDPALDPERTRDASVGFRLDPSRQWTLGADLWAVDARQTFGLLPGQWVLRDPVLRARYLQQVAGGPAMLVLPYQALGRAYSAGIDYEVQWRRPTSLGLMRLEFKGTTYLRSLRDPVNDAQQVSDLGQRSPLTGTVMSRHQLMLAAQLDRDTWHGSLRLYYRHGHEERWQGLPGSVLRVPAHWTIDLVQRWELSRALELNLVLHNLFNRIAWANLDGDGRLVPRHPQDLGVQGRLLRVQAQYRF